MIIHECIKCDYNEFIPICENPPMMEKYTCPKCGEEQYIYHSRIDPKTYSKDMVIIDEENKSIKILEQVEQTEAQKELEPLLMDYLAKCYTNLLLYGTTDPNQIINIEI